MPNPKTISDLKITIVVSDIDKALAFEWLAVSLQSLTSVSFILIGKRDTKLARFLQRHKVRFFEVPSTAGFLVQWFRVFFILFREAPDVVHTHLWKANLLGLSASWVLRTRKRVFTRHHSTLHYTEFPSGRKWDRLCNWLATDIVAISENVRTILVDWDHAESKKIHLIHHGFDLAYFSQVPDERIQAVRIRHGLEAISFPVIGVISRYMDWKGIQYVIEAYQLLLKKYPNAKLILANAHGPYARSIHELLARLPEASYREIKFEEDLAALYFTMNVFVHVPIDPHVEAFGQTYVEALLAGVPSIFTLSGVAPEFIRHKENAWVVDFRNAQQIHDGIETLLEFSELRNQMVKKGKESTKEFAWQSHVDLLIKLYSRL